MPDGMRLGWRETPARVRAAIQWWLGAEVVDARTQPGGFSPGLAARLRLADGRRVFVKAIGAERTPMGPASYRAEARVTAALPPSVPAPPARPCCTATSAPTTFCSPPTGWCWWTGRTPASAAPGSTCCSCCPASLAWLRRRLGEGQLRGS